MSETTTVTAATALVPRKGRRLPLTPYRGLGGFSMSDLIVICGGIALLIAGWALQRAHDARLDTAEIAGIQASFPEGWLPLPVAAPAIAQWTDDQGSGATLTLYAEPVPAEAAFLRRGSPNPVETQPAYTPMRSEPITMGGTSVIRSDYAFARQQVATSTPPEIVRGREVDWTANGQNYALALEAPDRDWSRVEPLFESLATAAVSGSGSEAEGGAG
jgi:hypothetical protein